MVISTSISLRDAIDQYDPKSDRDKLEQADDERRQVLDRFPLDRWSKMTLEEYAIGHEESGNSFCQWMEYKSTQLGSIRGGSARKHIIYKRRTGAGWYFPRNFDDERTAWIQLRSEFLQAFDHAKHGRWADIDGLDLLARGPVIRLKALYIYFPEKVLPVYSNDHLRHFLRLVTGEDAVTNRDSYVQTNQSLLRALREIREFEGWKTKELERFLYWWSDPHDARQILKIAPGRDAVYWEECLQGGYICAGWPKIGDLTRYESKHDFKTHFEEVYASSYNSHRPAISKKGNELWKFRELEPGDVVIANHGISRILAIGQVVEPGYVWRDDRSEFKHTVTIEWDTTYATQIPQQKSWAMATVAKVSDALLESIISKAKLKGRKAGTLIPIDPIYKRIASALERKLQLVLYGPPGTGKTYTARRFAVWWLLRESGDSRADTVLGDSKLMARCEKELSTVQVSGRVWWVVANPKEWSWKQLQQDGKVTYRYGRLKKNYPLVQRGDLVVGYQASPDKKIVALARISREMQAEEGREPYIELEWVSSVDEGLTYQELLEDKILAGSEPIRSRCQGTLFSLSTSEADHLLSLLSERNSDLHGLDEGGGGEPGCLTRVTFHPSYTYEDFIEGFRPSERGEAGLALHLEDGLFKRVCRAAQAHPGRPYLIVVDEFNRGNVAKILGELITLLERDKRGLTVSLPQSKETFSIPPNVYLLGTMNTADRSINLLDAALRRRFAFIELMPDLELLRGAMVGELALDEFLEGINARIAESEGREKQIGHAYLLDGGEPVTEVEDFADLFREEILPLLQEYCYDEYETLARFIGSELVDEQAKVLNQEKIDDSEQLVRELAKTFGNKSGVVE